MRRLAIPAVTALTLGAIACTSAVGGRNQTPPGVAPSAQAAPSAVLGTWELARQDGQSFAAQGVAITFTADGKHSRGPYLPDCSYVFVAPDTLKTDCSRSMADFRVDYRIRSVDRGTLVLVNPQVDQVNVLTQP